MYGTVIGREHTIGRFNVNRADVSRYWFVSGCSSSIGFYLAYIGFSPINSSVLTFYAESVQIVFIKYKSNLLKLH